jgi:branched-subunit amino acid transport protein
MVMVCDEVATLRAGGSLAFVSVPVAMLAALMFNMALPSPVKVPARVVAHRLPMTSSFARGTEEPIPTLLLGSMVMVCDEVATLRAGGSRALANVPVAMFAALMFDTALPSPVNVPTRVVARRLPATSRVACGVLD